MWITFRLPLRTETLGFYNPEIDGVFRNCKTPYIRWFPVLIAIHFHKRTDRFFLVLNFAKIFLWIHYLRPYPCRPVRRPHWYAYLFFNENFKEHISGKLATLTGRPRSVLNISGLPCLVRQSLSTWVHQEASIVLDNDQCKILLVCQSMIAMQYIKPFSIGI